MSGPLEGVRVMDVGTAGVGPWAATLLGLLGADVLKIESPAGDRHLYQPPLQKGLSTTYTSLNLNKRAATVDLKDPEAWPSVERMVRQADVIMDNLRPGVVDRMGVGFQAAREINPRIISASSSSCFFFSAWSALEVSDPKALHRLPRMMPTAREARAFSAAAFSAASFAGSTMAAPDAVDMRVSTIGAPPSDALNAATICCEARTDAASSASACPPAE